MKLCAKYIATIECPISSYLLVTLSILRRNYPSGGSMQIVEPWLSVTEIAQHLGISKETVYRWLDKQKIPSHRIGKLWKFKATEVDSWIMSGGADEVHQEKEHLYGK